MATMGHLPARYSYFPPKRMHSYLFFYAPNGIEISASDVLKLSEVASRILKSKVTNVFVDSYRDVGEDLSVSKLRQLNIESQLMYLGVGLHGATLSDHGVTGFVPY